MNVKRIGIIPTIILVTMTINNAQAGGTAIVNGQTYYCSSGNISIINQDVYCNGQIISNQPDSRACSSEVETECGFEKVKRHENGGGVVSECLRSISVSSFIDQSSKACGESTIGPQVQLRNQSVVTGSVEITGESVLSKSEVSGSSYIEDSNLTDSVVNGSGSIYNSELTNTVKSGSGDIEDSTLTLSNISGSGDIENSTLHFVNKSGSGDIKRSNLSNEVISGSRDIRGQR